MFDTDFLIYDARYVKNDDIIFKENFISFNFGLKYFSSKDDFRRDIIEKLKMRTL